MGAPSGIPPRKWQLAAFWRLVATLRKVSPEPALVARRDEASDPAAAEDMWAGARGDAFQGLIPAVQRRGC